MTDLTAETVSIAAEHLSDRYPFLNASATDVARVVLGAAAPDIRKDERAKVQHAIDRIQSLAATAQEAAIAHAVAAEREQIRRVIDRGKIAWMIHAFDLIDQLAASRGLETSSEVQDDLRKLADLLQDPS